MHLLGLLTVTDLPPTALCAAGAHVRAARAHGTQPPAASEHLAPAGRTLVDAGLPW